jgi:hypothetical protein
MAQVKAQFFLPLKDNDGRDLTAEIERLREVIFVGHGVRAMADREQIEQQIREALATETAAIPLSDRLFSPSGLFNQLASTEAERRLVVQSPLFQEAQRRLSALQRKEAAEFELAVEQAQSALPGGEYLVKLEHVGTG